jgi:hypothetical protein
MKTGGGAVRVLKQRLTPEIDDKGKPLIFVNLRRRGA